MERLEVRQLLAREVTGTIAADESWSGTVEVTGDVTIPDGVNLTIDPGTVVKFRTGKWIKGIGSVDAIGTAQNPIVFTSVLDDSVGEDLTPTGDGVPAPGDWDSVYVYSGDWNLQHAEVRYAGRNSSQGSLHIDEGTDTTENGTSILRDVLVTHSGTTGVDIVSGDTELTRIRVVASDGVPFRHRAAAAATYQSISAEQNADGDHVRVDASNITTDRVWDFGGLPAHASGRTQIFSPGSLTVAAGSVIKFEVGGDIYAYSGPLIAEGTPQSPIVFTATTDDTVGGDSNADGDATSPTPGHWDTLRLWQGSSSIAHAEVRYAGRSNFSGVDIDGSTVTDSVHDSLTNVRIVSSGKDGLRLSSGDTVLQNLTIENSAGVAIIQAFAAQPSYDNVVMRGNVGDHVRLAGGTINTDRVWDFGGLPVHLTGRAQINSPGTLTVVPGSVIKFAEGVDIYANSGPLIAEGTADAPIVFTATTDDSVGGDSNADGNATVPTPGHWRTIYLWQGESSLAHAEIRYAGGSGVAGINLNDRTANEDGVSQSLSDVRIISSGSVGLIIDSGNPTLQNVTISDSIGRGITQAFASQPIYDGVNFRGNIGGDHVLLAGGTVTTDRVWDFGGLPVHLSNRVQINQPGSLTIVPGTLIKFTAGADIYAASGPLIAEGTVNDPIIFTATTDDTVGGDSNSDGNATLPEAGDWRSLYLWEGNSSIAHAEVRYAGRSGAAGININGPKVGEDEVSDSISNVRIMSSGSQGLELSGGNPTLNDLLIANSIGVAINQAFAAQPTYDGVTLRDNAGDHIRFAAGTVTTDRVWDFDGLPIHVTSRTQINSPGSLTIVPGTVIKMGPNADFYAASGPLIAEGTADAPIIFTSLSDDTVGGDSNDDGASTQPSPGDWQGLYLWQGSSSIAHAEIRYAGRSAVGAIDISESSPESVSIANVSVFSSAKRWHQGPPRQSHHRCVSLDWKRGQRNLGCVGWQRDGHRFGFLRRKTRRPDRKQRVGVGQRQQFRRAKRVRCVSRGNQSRQRDFHQQLLGARGGSLRSVRR